MNAEKMIKLIAEYFKTQPVLKAWIFGSYSWNSVWIQTSIF